MYLRILALTALFVLPGRLHAEETDTDRAARWQDLRHAILADRPVRAGAGVITLEAPVRALDAALVPITVKLSGPAVKSLYVIVDDNPSPLAGTFHFGPAADTHEVRLRVRVDAYTDIHAVAETEDGQLYEAAAFVKAAGGCSAPAGGDARLAMERLGQMKLKIASDGPPGVEQLQLLVSHPNFNGMQMDQLTRTYTPARFIQRIEVTTGGKLVFDFDSDISLSADPAITFGMLPRSGAPVVVDVRDSAKAAFRHSFDLPTKGT